MNTETTTPAGTVGELVEILRDVNPESLIVNYDDRALVAVELVSAGWVEVDRYRLRFGRVHR